jgi:hypothetical protein
LAVLVTKGAVGGFQASSEVGVFCSQGLVLLVECGDPGEEGLLTGLSTRIGLGGFAWA